MTLQQDIATKETWIVLDDDELKMGFATQFIEALAEYEHVDYIEMLDRMEKANMIDEYIIKHYDTLHTLSAENIISELSEMLHYRESNL